MGAAAIALADFVTPLSQINFFPDLMHVYVLLDTTDVRPAFEHTPPALVAALAEIRGERAIRESAVKKLVSFFFIDQPTFSTFTTSPKCPASRTVIFTPYAVRDSFNFKAASNKLLFGQVPSGDPGLDSDLSW